MNRAGLLRLQVPQPRRDDMLAEVLEGLRRQPRSLPSKYFYDPAGSALFERICEQPEYYLTRTEIGIMREHAADIAAALGPRVLLMEYGSGSGLKTRLLLAALSAPVAYAPVEISRAALLESLDAIRREFPALELLPVCADFTAYVAPPRPAAGACRRVIYFPGSTLGNFTLAEAVSLLRQMRREMGPGGAALVGIDLRKDPALLEAAYNDAAGVTAAFTLNMLARFNRELDADFDLAAFRHCARYNAMAGRIETHILSLREQAVRIDGHCIPFARGDAILVEYSYKYALEQFALLARQAGLRVAQQWSDAQRRFSLQYLVPDAA